MTLYSEDPYKFRVGDEDILHGLTHGVSGMCNGERRRLRIPPELAYGDVNGGEVKGYSVKNDCRLTSLGVQPQLKQYGSIWI